MTRDPEHRVEWAVLSDDGRVYEVEGRAREVAFREAALLCENEPGVRVVERRVCTWAAHHLHEPDADPELCLERRAFDSGVVLICDKRTNHRGDRTWWS